MKYDNDLVGAIAAIVLAAILTLLCVFCRYEPSWVDSPEFQHTTSVHIRKGDTK